MKGLRPRRPGMRGEDGLSLIEAVISISVLMFVALGLTQTMIAGYRALRTTKTVQQATALGDQTVEAARALSYEALSHNTTDTTLASDSDILTTCTGLTGSYFFDPDGSGPLKCEKLVYSAAGGGIDPHVNTGVAVGSETYSVRQYATWVDGSAQGGTVESYKRFVTVVTWNFAGATKTYRSSTLITGNTHGIPVLDFEVTPVESNFSALRGEQVVFAHTIKNAGIPESFDLSLPNPVGYTWTKVFYRDVNGNDTYEAGTDTALTDTNGNGTVDTGTLATDATIDILEVWTLGATDTAGTPVLTLTVTPFSDATAAKSVTLNLTVSATAPELQLWLHNYPTPPTAHTNSTKALPMDDAVPTATTLYNYSNNYYNHVGRVTEDVTLSATEADPDDMVNWVWQAPTDLTLQGTMTLRITFKILPEAGKNNCNQGDWAIYLRKKSTSTTDTGTVIASDTKNKDPGCAAQTEEETLTIPRTNLLAGEWLELKLMTDKTKGPGFAWYYDTTNYDSYVVFPQVAARF
ncbi:MAG TPA: hypothetical protein VE174_04840 [Actinomycetota bacterium]|nr:hypothetical protein [Actinomycetota bacterium]